VGRDTCFFNRTGMKVLHVCMMISSSISGIESVDVLEHRYQCLYKKLISYLYNNPSYKLTFSFPGQFFSWITKKHPEFIQVLKELISRKQTEVLGGGYFNPVFPLLFPMDRSGQIEKYSSELSEELGRRPRGMTVYGSVWDNTLVSSLYSCDMEYVLLDNSLIPPSKRHALPLLLTDQGKSVKVLPFSHIDGLSPEHAADAGKFLADLKKQTESQLKKRPEYAAENRVVCIRFDCEYFRTLFEGGWIEQLYQAALNQFDGSISMSFPQEFLHKNAVHVPAYIAPGIQSDIAQWGLKPYMPQENKTNYPVTIYDFLSVYPRNHALYDRVMYISMLVANCHGDKARKKLAREKLWQAQTGNAFICDPNGIFATNAIRQNAYRALTEAEKIVRDCYPKGKSFQESVTSFDYNADGNPEYVCQMQSFDACISPKGASIVELDIMHNTGNYADNLKRIEKFDSVDDHYERGLFVEHLFTHEEMSDYNKGLPTGSGIFSQVFFNQTRFDRKRHEINLLGTGEFSSLKMPVSLRKNYIINSNGFTVQYILKNESPIALRGALVVESNFAQTDFSSADCNSYGVEVISSGERKNVNAEKSSETVQDISYMQITDMANDISFVYEPNEDADVTCMPLFFKRPKVSADEPQIAGTTFVAALSWNVDLAAGMEMEKTINFTIITPKKRRGGKKSAANASPAK